MNVKNLFFLLAFSALFVQASCGKVVNTVFGPKTPREQYEKMLAESPEGLQWKAASEMALAQPVAVELPYRQKGIFPDTLTVALGLKFTAKMGQQLIFDLEKESKDSFTLFTELFYLPAGEAPQLVQSVDTATAQFSFTVADAGDYLLRLQPKVDKGGRYDLSVSSAASIGFPVSDPKANIGSFWGAIRDGGKRNHEGIDIFAKKGSPAIAALDGMITGVNEGGIGGKVVWMRPSGTNYSLYYAHLDSQLVVPGQSVQKGDQLGTVGNTGNARYTPAHLHFGIYTMRGAVDPLPFVDRKIKKAAPVAARPLSGMLKPLRTGKQTQWQENTLLVPLGLNADGYLVLQPDSTVALAPFKSVKLIPNKPKVALAARVPQDSNT